MVTRSAILILIAALMFAGGGLAQQADMQRAQKLFAQKDWPSAAKAFQEIVASQPKNSRAWMFLGAALHQQKKFDQAISAFEKADALGFASGRARFNIARALARMNKTDDSLNWLEKATEAGFSQMQALESEPDLASLRSHARFSEIKTKTDRNARPCEYNPDCRAFDFWIGEWEVFNPNGQNVGENVIEKNLNGCLLLENWTSAGGGAGKSMNYYDVATQKWKQLWVDGTGGHMVYEGIFKEGALHFEGYQIKADGSKSLFKMIFTPQENGDVRQYIEQSMDGGKTYQTWFDGMYKKKSAP